GWRSVRAGAADATDASVATMLHRQGRLVVASSERAQLFLSASEVSLELADREADDRRAAVGAEAADVGAFEPLDQLPHQLGREGVAGADGAVAGDGRGGAVEAVDRRLGVLERLEQLGEQAGGVGAGQSGWQAAHQRRAVAERLDFEAEARERRAV